MSETRDVTNSNDSIHRIISFLKDYIRQPLTKIIALPDWSLKEILIVQLLISLASGLLAGFFPPNLWKIAQGIFLFPIMTSLLGALLAAFLYYYFQIFERRTVSYIKLLQLAYLADIFFFIFHLPANFFAFSDIFGMAMTAILMVIGLTENFQLEKKKSIKLISLLYLMVFLIWLTDQIKRRHYEREPNSVSQSSETTFAQ